MPVKMPRVMLMACLLSSIGWWPSLSLALGLGEIHLYSSLNEPMNAEIDLLAATPEELSSLHAALASREAFTRYGIDKPAFLGSLTFTTGKGRDGHDSLLVRSADSIPEPFVTFLVEVNWARGRLMREYTVLLDPPVYAPGANVAAPVLGAATAAPPVRREPPAATAPPTAAATPPPAAAPARNAPAPARNSVPPPRSATPPARVAAGADAVRVNRGDTLIRIAQGLRGTPTTPGDVDQTMIALFRANPPAFGGNINLLREGSVLRVPNADQMAALNQRDAIDEVHRQMDAWRGGEAPAVASNGHLRLVAPTTGGSATGVGSPAASAAAAAEASALKGRVKDLESQLAESKRLLDVRSNELAALQRKLAKQPPPAVAVPPAAPPTASTAAPAVKPPAAREPAAAPPPPAVVSPAAPVVKPAPPAPVPSVDNGSWIDWVAANWWVPVALLAVVLAAIVAAAMRRRRNEQNTDISRLMEDTDIADPRDPTSKLGAVRKGPESFVVEESGAHPVQEFAPPPGHVADTGSFKTPDDTMSSESAVNIDQGDPLAEADFHMAYGLYDQAADLVRIALEREPDRRDLRLKLLEIYFVWGNKDMFLQTAKSLDATRDRAPAGEWDKIVIMGKQICPDDPLFSGSTGPRGATTPVDLNLEGGENRLDLDLFGEPEGERSSLDFPLSKDGEHRATETAGLGTSADHLDFMLDAPERGADDSPTRAMPPRDEPTVESELMDFSDANFIDPLQRLDSPAADSPTSEAPALRSPGFRDRLAGKLPPAADQTAEVSIDDLGLNLDSLEDTGEPSALSLSELEEPHEHPADAPTMVAGLDERSRRMMEEAAHLAQQETHPDVGADAVQPHDIDLTSRERDLTELERELEASFVADLDGANTSKTVLLGPEAAPTVLIPREVEGNPTSRFTAGELTDLHDPDKSDTESTSKLRSISSDSIDLDLDRLASALGGDTMQQPRAEEDLFSSEVFELPQSSDTSQRLRRIDLDVGEALSSVDSPTNRLTADTSKLKPVDLQIPELEPVTMSEVGTKLDLARAYMDMGDPEGARSILEEVVHEGSASQKQEASRLIESLPG